MTAKEIARNLHISVKTVDRHKANIMNKLSMRSQIELSKICYQKWFCRSLIYNVKKGLQMEAFFIYYKSQIY